jgi:hypothetical protein
MVIIYVCGLRNGPIERVFERTRKEKKHMLFTQLRKGFIGFRHCLRAEAKEQDQGTEMWSQRPREECDSAMATTSDAAHCPGSGGLGVALKHSLSVGVPLAQESCI